MLKTKFVVATPAALAALEANKQSASTFLTRHSNCDWGEDLCNEDKLLNDQALIDGSRLLSSYLLNDNSKIWIIADAEDENGMRGVTVLLPSDY